MAAFFDEDDLILSQALELAETENSLEELSLTQTVELYDVNMSDCDDLDLYGHFDFSDLSGIANDDEAENMDMANYIKTEKPQETSGTKDRFGFCEDREIGELKKQMESKNTRKTTNWSVTTFNEWRAFRGEKTGTEIPELLDMREKDINCWLSRFVVEARRKDGNEYPPKSLYQLCVGLMRYMKENGNILNFLDEKNAVFYEFRSVLSARMGELTAKGIGIFPKQADPITKEQEELLWEKGVLGNSSSKSLLYTVFYYNCKLFGLRAVDEHRNLTIGQFELSESEHDNKPEMEPQAYLVFKGRTSKTYKGGLNQRHITAKSVRHVFSDTKLKECYKDYLKRIGGFGNGGNENVENEAFYRRPLENGKFSKQCIGVNKLSTLIKSMCADGGLQGQFTNHSGKRTCATSLYQAGVEEQEIMARTGHRSITAVRQYKRPSEDMLKDISNVLEPNQKRVKTDTALCADATGNSGNYYSNCQVTFHFNK